MMSRDIALLALGAICISCATVVDDGTEDQVDPSGDGDGDGDLASGDGDGDGDGDAVVPGSGGIAGDGDGGLGTGGGTPSGGVSGDGDGAPSGGASPGSGGGSPTGTELFADDFEAGTDQWTFGAGWVAGTDGTAVLEQTILDSTARIAYAGEMWGDVVMEGRMKILESEASSSSYAGFTLRTSDGQNGLALAFQGNGDLKIKTISAGSDSSLSGAADGFVVATNTWYLIRFQIIGQSMIAFVDGAPVLSYSHPGANLTGMVGVVTDRARAVFDDVVVTVP